MRSRLWHLMQRGEAMAIGRRGSRRDGECSLRLEKFADILDIFSKPGCLDVIVACNPVLCGKRISGSKSAVGKGLFLEDGVDTAPSYCAISPCRHSLPQIKRYNSQVGPCQDSPCHNFLCHVEPAMRHLSEPRYALEFSRHIYCRDMNLKFRASLAIAAKSHSGPELFRQRGHEADAMSRAEVDKPPSSLFSSLQ